MPRLKDADKRAKLGALQKMKKASWWNPFGPSADKTLPEIIGEPCIKRNGEYCDPPKPPAEPEIKPKEKDDEDDE